MIIDNRYSYFRYIIKYVLLAIIAILVAVIIGKITVISSIILFVLVLLMLLVNKFTKSIITNQHEIRINYFRFLFLRRKIFKINEVSIELFEKQSFRNNYNYLLLVIKDKIDNSILFEIDSRDGFDSAILRKITQN